MRGCFRMEKKDIMMMLRQRIRSCYGDLLFARQEKYKEFYIEGFRSRLDELILMYHLIKGISFVEACKDLSINYKDVDTNDVLNKEGMF